MPAPERQSGPMSSEGTERRGSAERQLLVSVPDTGDDNFEQSVVLVLEHDEGGAFGIVLNRPSATDVSDHLDDVGVPIVAPEVFFVGGPVSIGGLMAVGRRRMGAELEHATILDGPLVVVDAQSLVNGEVRGVELVRLFTGYSGWSAGQLDAELAAGAWYLVEATPDDVLCADPEQLWRQVMRRQGGRIASQGLFPDDVSVN